MRLVQVEWEDAAQLDTTVWVDRGTMDPGTPTVFQQVGWLLEDTEKHVVLTCTIHEDTCSPRTLIPRGMVRKIFDLVPARPSRARPKC